MHFEGIKGKCWFAKYCSLTEAVVIDFMHLLGLVKQMLGLLLYLIVSMQKLTNIII